MPNDKPNAEKLGWTLLETHPLYADARFTVRRERVRLPDGEEFTFTYPAKDGAVFILPLTPAGELVLIRQYRYLIDAWLWEIPAGSTHDFAGDDYRDLVRRELWEEIGGRAGEILPLGYTFAMPGFTTAKIHGYLALDVRLEATNHPESTECIEVHPLPIPQALELLRAPEQTSAVDAYFALQQEPLLRAIHARVTAGETWEEYVKRKTSEICNLPGGIYGTT